MFNWQDNNGTIEIFVELDDGFAWVCDCGNSGNPISEAWAKYIVDALNNNNQIRIPGQSVIPCQNYPRKI